MSVRVRFAPSPTGYLHVGGLRTALYNYLFAKHSNGEIIIRIEDTDRTRLVENAQESLLKSLSWAGIEFDEGPGIGGEFGPYIQSERLDIYKKYADELIADGKAYYAFDSPEEIAEMRKRQQATGENPKYARSAMKNQFTLGNEKARKLIADGTNYVIRLNVPAAVDISFRDVIRGHITVNTNEIDDQILMKSDGFPTYHLANVVDDHLMKITHVIRGEEWLPSTPKHILLYDGFGWEKPEFAHLPLLLNEKKAKLSKRHGDVAVEDFIGKGYFKEAFVNFIALLGWNPTGDREIYSIEELIELFRLDKVNKGGAIFDTRKLEWTNSQYMKTIPAGELAAMLIPLLREKGIERDAVYVERIIELFRERVHFIREIPDIAGYMFNPPVAYEEKYYNKHWKEDTDSLILPLIELFRNADEFTHDATYSLTKEYAEGKGLKLRDVIHPIRLMITGQSTGAGMFETMEVLGKEECLSRMDSFMENFNNQKLKFEAE